METIDELLAELPRVTLPPIERHTITRACSSRHGVRPTLVVLHRWAGGSFNSVVNEFMRLPADPTKGKSSTLVYAGERGRDAGRCVQLVPLALKPWTNAAWNPHTVTIECADDIWIGDDDAGLHRLARMVGYLTRVQLRVPAVWVRGNALLKDPSGFCRHADLGKLGGGHPRCPLTDSQLHPRWVNFCNLVSLEVRRGGFRPPGQWAH